MQISNYENDGVKYLVLSSATKDPFRSSHYRSISIGLLINQQLKRKLKFLSDSKIKEQNVGVTCERCDVKNCMERKVPATILDKEAKNEKIEKIVEDLKIKYSS